MLIIGLTGGVASGKTMVSRILKEKGAYIIDADQIARELVQPHQPAWKAIVKAFGKEILQDDRTIHRKKLAAEIFSDPQKRRLLNQILHPRIKREMDRRKKEIQTKDPDAMVVMDAPLLIELGGHRKMDKLIVVTTNQLQQIRRLRNRNGIQQEEALKIIASQIPQTEKVKQADFIIRNIGTLQETRQRTLEVFKTLKKTALQTRKQAKPAGFNRHRKKGG